MVNGPHAPPAFLAPEEATVEAIRRMTMKSTFPRP